MSQPRVHQVGPTTITTAGNSGALPNLGRSIQPEIIAHLTIAGPVTGTTPSLTLSVDASADGVNFASVGTFTAQTVQTPANTSIRLPLANVLDPYLRVSWTVSGTTPSFAGVQVLIVMSSPDN
jgi:hypothetical protein